MRVKQGLSLRRTLTVSWFVPSPHTSWLSVPHSPMKTACHPVTPNGSVTSGASVSGPVDSITPENSSVSYGIVCQWYFCRPADKAAAGVHTLRSVT